MVPNGVVVAAVDAEAEGLVDQPQPANCGTQEQRAAVCVNTPLSDDGVGTADNAEAGWLVDGPEP